MINIKNVSHAVAADVEVPEGGASGVIVAQGGAFGGWSLYLRDDGAPAYCYNLMGMQSTKVVGSQPLTPGRRRVVMVFDYDGGGPGRGGAVTLTVDGETVAEGRLERNGTPGVLAGRDVRRRARQRPSGQRRLPVRARASSPVPSSRCSSRSRRVPPTSATSSTRSCACPWRWPASSAPAVAGPSPAAWSSSSTRSQRARPDLGVQTRARQPTSGPAVGLYRDERL